MAKKIFKEKQRFTGWEVIFLLAFFIIGLTYRFVSQHWLSPVADPMSVWTYVAFIIPLVATLWYLIKLRLSIMITEKSITVKYGPFNFKKHKFKWENVEECEICESGELSRMSGWEVNFDHEKRFSLIGRKGIHLKTKEGENIFIGTKNLQDLKQAVGQVLG